MNTTSAPAERAARLREAELLDEIRAHASASPAHRGCSVPTEGDNWQPIETAPKDGTRVLLIGKVYGGIPFAGVWCPSEFAPGKSWLNAISITRVYDHVPTHWQPLPAPPKGGA